MVPVRIVAFLTSLAVIGPYGPSHHGNRRSGDHACSGTEALAERARPGRAGG